MGGHLRGNHKTVWLGSARARVLVSAPRRNDRVEFREQSQISNQNKKFAIARARSPAREARALPRATASSDIRSNPVSRSHASFEPRLGRTFIATDLSRCVRNFNA